MQLWQRLGSVWCYGQSKVAITVINRVRVVYIWLGLWLELTLPKNLNPDICP